MSKTTSLFLCFFLFSLIAMPTSSATRMILQEDVSGCPEGVNSCDGVVCNPQVFCVPLLLVCPLGQYSYKQCCSCSVTCCPIRND
ncbi:hypothetical protein C5167_014759 [Papaver somniferum]|uniref:Uncharacterized protein n=1 Tax=Papaver somniferum TaxID=3469 RepID=A0A4Y7J785_PAPSO|nr:hypothetical protein C5167_014758 [Papaver somniferum]RZC55915.1 hypothetical protein C5167_014759 [Papaver somniferum]